VLACGQWFYRTGSALFFFLRKVMAGLHGVLQTDAQFWWKYQDRGKYIASCWALLASEQEI